MFPDDIVLLADKQKGLQEPKNRVEELCSNWDLSINIKKTKIVIFSKPTCSFQFLYTIPL